VLLRIKTTRNDGHAGKIDVVKCTPLCDFLLIFDFADLFYLCTCVKLFGNMINMFETRDFSSIEMIDDNDLIESEMEKDCTKSCVYISAVVHESKKTLSGYVIEAGRRYPIHIMNKNDRRF
jgi:hypothetical protein